MSLRLLSSHDAAQLDDFLALHRDSSMFLRGNARLTGIDYRGEPYQAIYAAAFQDRDDDRKSPEGSERREKLQGLSELVGVAAHCWNGMLLLQAPKHSAELARACVAWSGRQVTGLSGPLDQVRQARAALGLTEAEAAREGDEWLYALDLSELVVPVALSAGAVACRPPREDEHATLYAWRVAYDNETLGATDSPEQRQRSAEFLDMQIAAANAWVAVADGVLVSLSAFNATLPDIVQLGGIYTPPPLRGRGYARAVVAAALVEARQRGASRAVLFTSNPNAVRCYEALGFRRVGDYSLVLLR